jgi:hypothetical protein
VPLCYTARSAQTRAARPWLRAWGLAVPRGSGASGATSLVPSPVLTTPRLLLQTLHPDLLNANVRNAQYAVRGELYLKARRLDEERGPCRLPLAHRLASQPHARPDPPARTLAPQAEELRRAGKEIIFTNGARPPSLHRALSQNWLALRAAAHRPSLALACPPPQWATLTRWARSR